MTRKPIKQKLTETEEKNLFFFFVFEKMQILAKKMDGKRDKNNESEGPKQPKKKDLFCGHKILVKKKYFHQKY